MDTKTFDIERDQLKINIERDQLKNSMKFDSSKTLDQDDQKQQQQSGGGGLWNGLLKWATPSKQQAKPDVEPSDSPILAASSAPILAASSAPNSASAIPVANSLSTNLSSLQSRMQSTSPTRLGLGMVSTLDHSTLFSVPRPAEDFTDHSKRYSPSLEETDECLFLDQETAPVELDLLDQETAPVELDLLDHETAPEELDLLDQETAPEELDLLDQETAPVELDLLDHETAPIDLQHANPQSDELDLLLDQENAAPPKLELLDDDESELKIIESEIPLVENLTLDNPSTPLKTTKMMTNEPLIQVSTPIATQNNPQATVRVLNEFDPLIPKDWMMSFDSPAPVMKTSESASSLPIPPSNTTSQNSTPSAVTQPNSNTMFGKKAASLLDSFDAPPTPKSSFIYSQKDMDLAKSQMKEKFDQEFMLAHQEIQDLTGSTSNLKQENAKIKETLAEWERAVTKMLQEREKERGEMNIKNSALQVDLDQTKSKLSQLQLEFNDVSSKWKQLRLDHSDMTEENTKQKSLITTLQADLQSSNTRFQTLKTHAEQKLQEANVEIARVRQTFEKELVAAKAKVSRLEASTNTLQRSLEGKTKECEELMKICDALEKQLALD